MRRKTGERGKTLLIVVLAVLAVALLTQALQIQGFRWNRQESQSEESRELSALLQPCAAAVTRKDTGRYGVWGGTESKLLYDRFSALLGDAVGSADSGSRVQEEDWQQALESNGVYFDLQSAIPLELLADWLGIQSPDWLAGAEVQQLCLAETGKNTRLYCRSEGGIFAYDTGLHADALQSRLEEFTANDAAFAFQREDCSLVAGDTLLTRQLDPNLSNFTMRTPAIRDSGTEELLPAFGINDYMADSYTEQGGDPVYVDGGKSLRLRSDGVLRFRSTEADGLPLELREAAQLAGELVQQVISGRCGEAGLRLWRVESGEDGYVFYFRYTLNGLPVCLSGQEYAARVAVGSALREADLYLREFTATGAMEKPLTPLLEAILLQDAGGGSMQLEYRESNGRVWAEWNIEKAE